MIDRRALIRRLAAAGALPLLPHFVGRAAAAGGGTGKFLQIFLHGGWDAGLATNPPRAGTAKAASGLYAPAYYTPSDANYPGAPQKIAGKNNIWLGAGLAAAASPLGQAAVATVNGLFVEVTAHELALGYLYSGQLSLSRSREYPAIIATMADKAGGFPAHVVLGGGIPLASTAATHPPMVTGDIETFAKMLAGPYKRDFAFKDASVDAAHALLQALNDGYQARLAANEKTSLAAWNAAESGLNALYAKRFDQRLALTAETRAAFGAATNEDVGARMALAAACLKEGVSRFMTVNFDGFDTHQSHFQRHMLAMAPFGQALGALVDFLALNADPDEPSKKLLETTTVLVSSEFNRTPALNAAGGTDHWQTGSALLFGRGVQDDAALDATDAGGNAVAHAAAGGEQLLPDHLAASILRVMGFTAEADAVSEVHLHDVLAP